MLSECRVFEKTKNQGCEGVWDTQDIRDYFYSYGMIKVLKEIKYKMNCRIFGNLSKKSF